MSKNDLPISFAEQPPISMVDAKPMNKILMNRRVWVIRDLITKPLSQKDIGELWGLRGEVQYNEFKKLRLLKQSSELVDVTKGYGYSNENDVKIWKPKKYKEGVGISKSDLSKIFNGDYKNHHTGLLEEGIVEKGFVNGKEVIRLVEKKEALYKILVEFNNPRLPETFKRELKRILMNSKYVKKIINKNLVENIEFAYESLNEKEINLIYTIIKISPSSLLIILDKLCNPNSDWKELRPKNEKENFLSDLQFKLYQDSINQKIIGNFASYPIPVHVEFNIETTIKTNDEEFQYASTLKKSSFEFLTKKEQNQDIENIEEDWGS